MVSLTRFSTFVEAAAMNSSDSAFSLFQNVELAPRDPILGLNETFIADTRPEKVNLGVGVYTNDEGKIPVLQAVQAAEKAIFEAKSARGYLGIDGIPAYNHAVQRLLFGAESELMPAGRVVTTQSLGGTGALRTGADFLKHLVPDATVAISNPSWENHRAIFENAGFPVIAYPYYDAATHGVNLPALLAAFESLPPRSIIVLHACCHNPTGVDLSAGEWEQVVQVLQARQHIPFLDLAYQGFGDGIETDAGAVRRFTKANLPFLVASSFSKSFSLYGERVGALSIVTADKDQSARVLSQIKRVIRTNYSSPPTHGARVVSTVLNSVELRQQWEDELGTMRERIKAMRHALCETLAAKVTDRSFTFVNSQRGMFSYSGLTAEQVERLRNEFGIYAVSSGRICVAALNRNNVEYVGDAIASVLKSPAMA